MGILVNDQMMKVMMKKKIIPVMALFLMMFGMIFLGSCLNQPTPQRLQTMQDSRLSLAIDPLTIQTGQTYTVDITLNAPPNQPVAGWQFDLKFDPNLIRINHLTEGPFFSHCLDAKTSFFIPGKTDNQAGVVEGVAAAGMGIPRGEGCVETDKILTLNLTAKHTGVLNITFSNILLIDFNDSPYQQVELRYGSTQVPWSYSSFVLSTIDFSKLSDEEIFFFTPDNLIHRDETMTVLMAKSPTDGKYLLLATRTMQAYATQDAMYGMTGTYAVEHPSPTPTAFLFHSPAELGGFILHSRAYRQLDPVALKECPENYTIGDPQRVTDLDRGMDFYYVPFYMGPNREICTVYTIEIRDDGAYFTGGQVHPFNPYYSYGENLTPDISRFPYITLEQARGAVEALGYQIAGEPRMVYMKTFNNWEVDEENPAWEVNTADGLTLYVGMGYHDLVVLPADEIQWENYPIKK
jgi:hypothetical protein